MIRTGCVFTLCVLNDIFVCSSCASPSLKLEADQSRHANPQSIEDTASSIGTSYRKYCSFRVFLGVSPKLHKALHTRPSYNFVFYNFSGICYGDSGWWWKPTIKTNNAKRNAAIRELPCSSCYLGRFVSEPYRGKFGTLKTLAFRRQVNYDCDIHLRQSSW